MPTPTNMRPHETEVPAYYRGYLSLVPDGEVVDQLQRQLDETVGMLADLSEDQARFRYAEGKWSIKEVVGHLCDTERVLSYRAMSFARGEEGSLPGFEQDDYVPHGEFDRRPLEDLLAELRAIRDATVHLFRSCSEMQWSSHGTANGVEFSVRALAWIIAGHELHHRTILRDRYLRR